MRLRAKGSLWLARVLVGALLLGAAAGALAQHCAAPAARVVSIQGSVELRPHNAKQWQAVQSGVPICSGDSVRTGPRSRAALLLPNDTTLRLDQGTTLTLSAPDQAQASLLDLILGTIHVISRTPRPFRVNTPYLNAGVEGTEFLVGSDEAGARLAVFEGRVSASNAETSLMLVGGEIAYAAKGAPLRKERMLRPADAVQWALYYPTLFAHRLGEQIAGTPGEAALRESIALYRQDRLAEAIFRLDKAPDGLANPRFLTYRAGLLLLVGRADEARSDIERALAVDAANSNAHALKSVVALTQNDKDQALKLATRAAELDQTSSVARLALSYAQQAHFKIEEALASVQQAVELDAQNALAWARLAELHMSTGYLDRALEAAKRAVSLNPELAKTQSVLGFANLTRIDTQAAKQAFEKAIDLDQADPLPRLGLGLAMIREGELTAGREQLEIAVCLDPENSLLRSYVGKAYYEEKRDRLAGIQFELAKERDPRDPTPWFYDAIRKQALNRTVGALHDVQRSIELNDDRAVYRSKLLLDQDQAARSANQARLYSDLGFDQLAVVEGYRSLALDPGNYSAHRFLAESYFPFPRYEVARVSELLQAQLRQPLNLTLLEPQLGESEVFVLRGTGPFMPGANEFDRLFVRNETNFVFTGLTGTNGTLGNQAILYGIRDNISFSVGQFHFYKDAFERNNKTRKNIYNLFVQASLSADASVQMEVRQSDLNRRLLLFPFDAANTAEQNRQDWNQTFRVGLRYAFSPESDVLVSAIHQRRDASEVTTFLSDGAVFFNPLHSEAGALEVQHLLRGNSFNWIAGASIFRGADETRVEIDSEEVSNRRIDRRNSNLHTYLFLDFGVHQAQIGLSIQRLSNSASAAPNVRKVDPKFGLILNPLPNLTLRGAWFMATKRPLLANQTLEPTQLAGFNQFFDDANAARSRRAGVGADLKLSNNLFMGSEFAKRRVSNPPGTGLELSERLDRAYLYYMPTAKIALGLDVYREQLQRPENDPAEGIIDLDTYRAPFKVSWFGHRGFSAAITCTYVRQHAGLQSFPDKPLTDQRIGFWTTDISLTFHLPKRQGLIDVGVRNIFDRKSNYQEIDATNPVIAPTRFVFARVSVAY